MKTSSPDKIDLKDALASFDETWAPRLIADVDGHHLRLAKLEGAFEWHAHADEDELFFCLEGRVHLHLREADGERTVTLEPGQIFLVPKGLEHLPVADPTASVLIVEKGSVVNTGTAGGERTRAPVPL